MATKAKIVSPGMVCTDARVYIDGVEVPRRGLHRVGVDMPVGEPPQLVLTFHATEIDLDHGPEVVHVTT
jgi:hypothetical protein